MIEPTVFDEAELGVYEELWDSARMITEKVISRLTVDWDKHWNSDILIRVCKMDKI